MRILFVTRVHLPRLGGVQWTVHRLAAALQDRGHEVAVLCPQPPAYGEPSEDRELGYLALRGHAPPSRVREVLSAFAPDMLLVGATGRGWMWTDTVLDAAWEVPTLVYLQDHPSVAHVRRLSQRFCRVAVVSRFLADEVGLQARSPATYLPPIVAPAQHRVETTRRVALMVNPAGEKGVQTALALARARPDIPFAFVRLWQLLRREARELAEAVEALDNVELRDSVRDAAELYGDARVLLAPSTVLEGWGRVASEAQASGIPVLGTRAGGLVEAIGDGGSLVRPDAPAGEWADALSALWDDDSAYAAAAERATVRAERDELRPEWVAERLERLAGELLDSASAARVARRGRRTVTA